MKFFGGVNLLVNVLFGLEIDSLKGRLRNQLAFTALDGIQKELP